jgi:hypothetical protein
MKKRKRVVIGTVAIEINIHTNYLRVTNPSSDHLRFYSIFGIPAPLFGFLCLK